MNTIHRSLSIVYVNNTLAAIFLILTDIISCATIGGVVRSTELRRRRWALVSQTGKGPS